MYDTDSGQRVQGICALHGRFHYDPAGERVCPDCATDQGHNSLDIINPDPRDASLACNCGHDREAHTHGNSGHLSYPRVREFVSCCRDCDCDEFLLDEPICKDCGKRAESFNEDGDVCTDCDRESYLAGNIRA